jgi:hypothetical protein
MITMGKAILSLLPKSKFRLVGNVYSGLEWYDERPQPTEEEIQAKIAELQAAEPLRLLRLERTRLLQQSDWMANSDVVMTDEWRVYRQALRDLPETQTPALDDNGNLINVEWPTPPGETSVS